MSRGYNRVILMGNLTRDPDVRHTTTKQVVAKFTIAVGNAWKDKATGEKKEHTDFISCQAWGTLADIAGKYLVKGKPVLVEGRISVRDYQDKTGQRKWVTDVMVESLRLLPSANRDQGSASTGPAQTAYNGNNGQSVPRNTGSGEDEYDFPLDFSELEASSRAPENVDVECPF